MSISTRRLQRSRPTTPGAAYSLWPSSPLPSTQNDPDPAGVTVGVIFSSAKALRVTAIRFYKGSQNTGTHIGALWSDSGTLLATVTFGGETASGWQTAYFSSPVAIASDTTYVASYYAPNGHYSANPTYFTQPVVSGPLTAPIAGNGVFTYGGSLSFPTSTYGSANYWVDIIATDNTPDTTPPSPPTMLVAATVGAIQVNLTWQASTDNYGVIGYDIYRDGAYLASSTGTSYTDTSIAASTTYSYAALAKDAAGNVSSMSTAATVTTGSPGSLPDPVGQPAGTWTPVFNDEFNATAVTVVDAPNGLVRFGAGPVWKAWYPNELVGDGNAHTNNPGTEMEYYDISGLSVGGGNLTLTATHDNAHAGFAYTSGMIQSNPSFNASFGYAEARLKAPGVSGSWPAFWMIPASYSWPPEFDIFENFGAANEYKVSDFNDGHTVFGNPITTDVTQWHVYGLKWGPAVLEWYLDGSLVAREGTTNTIPSEPMYLVVNLAATNTDNPSFSLQVDYVRFWQ